MVTLTNRGRKKVHSYILELKAKKKEILDAGLDTCEETYLPTRSDIECDIEYYPLINNEYINSWGVTDNYNADMPLRLKKNVDFVYC